MKAISRDGAQTVELISGHFASELSKLTNDVLLKLETFTDDLRLAAGGGLLLIRTNLDKIFNDLEENIVSVLMDNLESIALEESKLIGKVAEVKLYPSA